MRYVKIIWILLVSLLLTNCVNSSHTGALRTTMCLEYIEDNPYLIAMCAVGTGFVADGSWIEKPPGLKSDYVVEGNKRMNIFERNAYIEKYYPNN
jgi:hypothetical protein